MIYIYRGDFKDSGCFGSIRIKEEREKRQWTQDYLAETLNVSRQAISKWEVGSTYPDIDRLVQISNLFDITLDSLIKGDDSLKKSIVITKNAKAQTNVWEFMRSTGWMMVIAIIYLVTKMIIAVFS
ncbi:transcriptional regulator [Lactiplantibacillus plantarum]|nr:helix-turn-helix transcriptional regulator [Lactiplantibacillus plantarum]ANM75679.1 transcriptional regulator [Lactiplantibacillus plantarum]